MIYISLIESVVIEKRSDCDSGSGREVFVNQLHDYYCLIFLKKTVRRSFVKIAKNIMRK